MNLTNPRKAEHYLRYHGYKMVALIPHKLKLVFRKDSGDDSWESGIADKNGWVREEYGFCCLDNMFDDEGSLFCDCGVGVNNQVTWVKVKQDSTTEEMEKILYRGIPIREQMFND